MRTTPKYEFKKRELTDIADITATEDNWDKVEEELDNQDTALASHLADDAPHGIGDKSTLLTTEKSTIVGAVNELFTDVSNGKGVIASAIADMGQLATGSDTFAQLAAKIRDISDDATAGVGDVLAGKTFYQGGVKRTGTIPSKGAATITPGTANQTIAANQYLSGVQTILGDADLKAANILNTKNIFGVQGSLVPGVLIKSIQRGTTAVAGYSNINVNISSVNFNNSIVIAENVTPHPSSYSRAMVTLIDGTTIKADNYGSDSATIDWIVIEFERLASLQKGTIVISGSVTETTIAVSPVNLNKSILLKTSDFWQSGNWWAEPHLLMPSTSSIRAVKHGTGSGNTYVAYALIEFP